MADDDMKRLAKAARDLYVFHVRLAEERRTGVSSRYGSRPMPQWDGGLERHSGRTFKPVWPKVVRAALAMGAGLADYIAAQFDGVVDPPRPNQLISAAAAGRYEHQRGLGVHRTKLELDAQHAQLMVRVAQNARLCNRDDREATAVVLRDRQAALSALYRYCIAVRLGESITAAGFRESALTQYLASPSNYREAWGSILPDDLVAEGDAILSKLLGGAGGAQER